MSWLRIDDEFPDHRKVQALELDPRMWADALAVWVAVGCYVSRYGTGGLIPEARLSRMTPLGARAVEVAEKLIEVGLWERVDGALRYHDWDDFNEDHEEATKKRSAASERQKRWRENKRNASREASTQASTPRRAASTAASTGASTVDAYSRGRAPATRVPQPQPHPHDDREPVAGSVASVGATSAGTSNNPESEFGRRLDVFWRAWRKRFEHHRGTLPADGERDAKPKCVEAIAEHAEREGVPFERVLGEVLDAYWRDPWVLDRKNRPSLGNLLRGLTRLLEERSPLATAQYADDDPPDWHPAVHGAPKHERHYGTWNAWIGDGCPDDPTWQAPTQRRAS